MTDSTPHLGIHDASGAKGESDGSSNAARRNDKTSTANEFLPIDSMGPLERMSLHELLRSVASRLAALEAAIPPRGAQPLRENGATDVLKLLFGGWTVFAFVFLLLFYAPLRDVLVAIPEKIKTANEIGLPGGLTLKSTIEKVAALQGQGHLGEVIPYLSSDAIEVLLRAPRNNESLVSFPTASDGSRYTGISLPSPKTVRGLSELERAGLVQIDGAFGFEHMKTLSGKELATLIADTKSRFPGIEAPSYRDQTEWILKTPVSGRDWKDRPSITWRLSEAGTKAVTVVLGAVAAELSQPAKGSSGKTMGAEERKTGTN